MAAAMAVGEIKPKTQCRYQPVYIKKKKKKKTALNVHATCTWLTPVHASDKMALEAFFLCLPPFFFFGESVRACVGAQQPHTMTHVRLTAMTQLGWLLVGSVLTL